MSREFKFADLGEGITEGELIHWLVKVGDRVKEDQSVAEVETDKAVVEIPSPYSGVVESLEYEEGDVISVGSVLMKFKDGGAAEESEKQKPEEEKAKKAAEEKEPEGEAKKAPKEKAEEGETKKAAEDKTDKKQKEKAEGASREKKARAEESEEGEEEAVEEKPAKASSREAQSLPALATPHVRRIARELGVDIDKIKGSGPGGRVSERDVRLLAEGREEVSDVSSRLDTALEQGLTVEQFEKWGKIERKKLKRTRRKIAQHMIQAKRLTAPVTHIDEVDVTALVKLRDEQQKTAAQRGAKLTFLPFLIRAVATGLKKYPSLNASIVADEIIYKHYYNIGFAVDTEDGLLVPVLKNVSDKSILDLAVELQELSEKARDRKVELADLKGSSFTITNIGSIGGRYFTPIINYPDCAILGIGRVYEKPVARDGHVVIRHVMSLNLTFDHRVTDGATGARFINHLKERLEDPQHLFLDID